MRFTVELLRVTGIYATGKYEHTGTMSFCKRDSLAEAKNYANAAMKKGYYNFASIWDRDENVTMERFNGQDWRVAS